MARSLVHGRGGGGIPQALEIVAYIKHPPRALKQYIPLPSFPPWLPRAHWTRRNETKRSKGKPGRVPSLLYVLCVVRRRSAAPGGAWGGHSSSASVLAGRRKALAWRDWSAQQERSDPPISNRKTADEVPFSLSTLEGIVLRFWEVVASYSLSVAFEVERSGITKGKSPFPSSSPTSLPSSRWWWSPKVAVLSSTTCVWSAKEQVSSFLQADAGQT